jgi:hypothetical protein
MLVAGSWKTISVPDTSFNADIMLLLTDGSVLVHNGWVPPGPLSTSSQWLRLTPDNRGNYDTGTWLTGLDMQYARPYFASGMMSNGLVFVIGQSGADFGVPPAGLEIFDPQTNVWQALDKPTAFAAVYGPCNGCVLADGRALLGSNDEPSIRLFPPGTTLTAIWNPIGNTWSQAGLEFGAASTTTKKDPFGGETFCLLPDGSVLAPAVTDTPNAQRYLPSLDQWVDCEDSPVTLAVTTIQGNMVYKTGPVILLPGGTAFAIGGTGLTALYTPPPASDPAGKGSWTPGPSFPPDTSQFPVLATLTALGAPACLLPSGKVVCMGGITALDTEPFEGYSSQHPVLLEYNPASTATTLPPLDVQPGLPAGNYTHQSFMLLLPTGQMLLSAQTSTLFLYTPDPATSAPLDAWRPAKISVPSDMYLGYSYTVSGTQLNGLSQAVCYGASAGMATNYPIVQLTRNGQVAYARSHDFSMMGVATGTTVQSCTIDIPSDLAPGNWNLAVIANGIASEPVSVDLKIYPCQEILDQLEALSPGDFNTLAEYKQAVSYYLGQLKECEKEYGSP